MCCSFQAFDQVIEIHIAAQSTGARHVPVLERENLDVSAESCGGTRKTRLSTHVGACTNSSAASHLDLETKID